MLEWVFAVLIISGSFFAFVAGLGVLRLSNFYLRMHASVKAGTLGIGMILLGVVLYFGQSAVTARAFLTIIFILLTSPVSAHIIARAVYRGRGPDLTG